MRKVLVFDGSNVIMRAYYAVPKLSTSGGFPTNAIKGTVNIVVSTVMKIRPTHVVFVVDGDKPTFRHKLYAEYKGTRNRDPEVSESIGQQKPVLFDLLTSMGIHVEIANGVEADDIIGAIAHQAKDTDKVYIVSNDKDLAQCLRKNVYILRQCPKTKTQIRITRKMCEEVYGAKPKRIPCMLMMLGDSVDNVPGVKGIGAAAVSKLLVTSKRVEKADTSVLNKAQRAAFEAAASSFPLIRKLVEVDTSSIVCRFSHYRLKTPDVKQAIRITKALESPALRKTVESFAAAELRRK